MSAIGGDFNASKLIDISHHHHLMAFSILSLSSVFIEGNGRGFELLKGMSRSNDVSILISALRADINHSRHVLAISVFYEGFADILRVGNARCVNEGPKSDSSVSGACYKLCDTL